MGGCIPEPRSIETGDLGIRVALGEELPPEFREWIIDFGQGAYVVLYHYDGKEVVILAVRHGREVGY